MARIRIPRSLLHDVVDEHIGLSDLDRAKVHRRVQELRAKDRFCTALGLVPGAAAIALIPIWIWLQKRLAFPWILAIQLGYAAMVIEYLWWMWRRIYIRFARRVIHELRLAAICINCGYSRIGLAPEAACPECGSGPAASPSARPDGAGN